jgi:hypothetical protein
MKQLLRYIICGWLVMIGFSLFSFGQQEAEVVQFLDANTNQMDYTKSEAHVSYLSDSISLVPFDKQKWERLRMNIVNEISGVEYEGQEGSELSPDDNPYHQSRKQFQRYWREKNSKKIKRIPKEREKNERRRNRENDLFNPGSMSPFWSNFILVVVVLALAALIFFLFFNQLKEGKGNKKIGRELESIIPTEIPKSELELLLEKALAKEDYREAIRVYFIFVIRGLIKKNGIVWEKEKTNFSYLNEMRENPFFMPFESCVSVYEIVWYGERQLSKSEYEQVEPRFKKLVKDLDE